MQLTILFTLGLASLSTAQTVYLIRHGEKPDSGDGLSADGVQRSQCLRDVFASSTPYDIGKIIAQTPQSGKIYWTSHTAYLGEFTNNS
jgi:hypothetical protein